MNYEKSQAVKSNQKSLDRASLPNNMKRIIISSVGLTIVGKEDNSAHRVHQSVKQHLFEPMFSFS
jgi:hypothetical protein